MVSWEWGVNFAAGAAVSALFAPGAFQQSGFAIAALVTATSFLFSIVSLVAYARLTYVAQKACLASAEGRITTTNGKTLSEFQYRTSTTWSALKWNPTQPSSSLSSSSKKKRKGFSNGSAAPSSSSLVVPSAAFVVDFFGGFSLLTWVFEAIQQVDMMISYLLKVVAVVDLFQMFLLVEANSGAALSVALRFVYSNVSEWIGVDLIALVPMAASSGGIAAIVFVGVSVLVLLPPPFFTRWTALVCDVVIIALNVFLCAVLGQRLVSQFQPHMLTRPEVHTSLQYTPWERFYFSYVAILTSFLPHCNTLGALTTPAMRSVKEFGSRLHVQIRALLLQFVYFMILGVAVDIVMPPGRASSRIPVVVFNFVDYRTWLPADGAADESRGSLATTIALMFSLVPIAHLISAARGLSVAGPGQLSRLTGLSAVLPSSVLKSLWVLVLTHAAVTLRPVNVLIVCKCIVHAVYIAMYLKLLDLGDTAPSSASPATAALIAPRKTHAGETTAAVVHRSSPHAATHSLLAKLLMWDSGETTNSKRRNSWWGGVDFGTWASTLLDRRGVYVAALLYWITCLVGWI